MRRATGILQNLLLAIIAAALTIIALNFLFRIVALHLVNQETFPRALINYLDNHYHTFFASVNDRTFENWNAVLGDSYAAGAGDAYLQNKQMYGWMHFLRRQSGENYYIFARSGFGSINAAREFIVTTDEIKNSVFYPRYQEPRKVLFLFYEGNDLNDNLNHLGQMGAASRSLRDFVEADISRPQEAARSRGVSYPLLYLLANVYRDRSRFFADSRGHDAQAERAEAKNYVIIDETRRDFRIRPQSAAAELSEEQLELALNVFYESVRHLKKRLPNAKFEIVYLPSVVSVYTWDGPIYFETYHTDELLSTTYRANLARSKNIRDRISEFSKLERIAFIDTTEELIASGRSRFLHGPLDLRHFNEIGQQIVGETIFRKEIMLAEEPGR